MKTVLLIDDDNGFLLTIGVRLKGMGHTVYAAKEAVNAISAVRKNNPDVIVLDVSLPAADGFMVADRLQKLNSWINAAQSTASHSAQNSGCGLEWI